MFSIHNVLFIWFIDVHALWGLKLVLLFLLVGDVYMLQHYMTCHVEIALVLPCRCLRCWVVNNPCSIIWVVCNYLL